MNAAAVVKVDGDRHTQKFVRGHDKPRNIKLFSNDHHLQHLIVELEVTETTSRISIHDTPTPLLEKYTILTSHSFQQ